MDIEITVEWIMRNRPCRNYPESRIRELIGELKIKVGKEYLILNRAGDETKDLQREAAVLQLKFLGSIPLDPLIESFDLDGKSLLELPDDSPSGRAAFPLFGKVVRL